MTVITLPLLFDAMGFAVRVTDYMTKPFKPAHVRARVHVWLAKTCRRGRHVNHGVAFSDKPANPVVTTCASRRHSGFGLTLYTNLEERQLRKVQVQEQATNSDRW